MSKRDEKGCWLPGSSPNPSGRPIGAISLESRLRRKLRENPQHADEIINTLISKSTGEDANPAFMRIVLDRNDGPMKQVVENVVTDSQIYASIGFALAKVYPENYDKAKQFIELFVADMQGHGKSFEPFADEAHLSESE